MRGGHLIVPALAQSIDDINGFIAFNHDRISLSVPPKAACGRPAPSSSPAT